MTLVVVASVSAPLQIDAGLRIESKTEKLFTLLAASRPQTQQLQDCHVVCLSAYVFPLWRAAIRLFCSGRHNHGSSNKKVHIKTLINFFLLKGPKTFKFKKKSSGTRTHLLIPLSSRSQNLKLENVCVCTL
jgi:hypothetical protein